MAATTSDRRAIMNELLPPHVEPGEAVFGYGEVDVNKWPAGLHPMSIDNKNQEHFSVVLTDRRILFAGIGGFRKDGKRVALRGVINMLRYSSISAITTSTMAQRRSLAIIMQAPTGKGLLELFAFKGLTGMGSKDPEDDQSQRTFHDHAYDAIFGRANGTTATGFEGVANREFVYVTPGKPPIRELIPFGYAPQ